MVAVITVDGAALIEGEDSPADHAVEFLTGAGARSGFAVRRVSCLHLRSSTSPMLPSFIFMKDWSPLIFRLLRHLADSAGRSARLALLLAGMSCMAATIGPLSPTYSTADAARIDIRQLPVAFEAIDHDAASSRYRARFQNYDVFLDSSAISVRLSEPAIRSLRGLNRPTSTNTATLNLSFHGTDKASVPVGKDRLQGMLTISSARIPRNG